MNKIICIIGPTGTGKTQKALELAQEYPSILISADSRQVYRGMDVVTGKDHQRDITIYGIDIVDPDEACSIAVWYDAVDLYIKEAWSTGKQVIVVGGTGLYVKAITEGIETMKVPIDHNLRHELATLSIIELQEKLKKSNIAKYKSLNHSDFLNPRRLIRAIEVALSPSVTLSSQFSPRESTLIGLKYFDELIYRNKIKERVESRIKNGAVEETQSLLSRYDKNLGSMSAIGYKSIIGYLEGKFTENDMIQNWIDDELRYSKRQMTWFRKVKSIKWYDIDITKG